MGVVRHRRGRGPAPRLDVVVSRRSKHPRFEDGDVVIPTPKARDLGEEPEAHLVLEVLRGPKMVIRSRSGPDRRVMRKHFEVVVPVEERLARELMREDA